MQLNKLLVIWLVVVMSFNAKAALITSTFDDGAEGWRLAGATTSGAKYSSGGDFIFGVDTAKGGLWYFEAPKTFLGDLSGAYNQYFNFDSNFTSSGRTLGSGSLLTIFGGGTSIVMNGTIPLKSSSVFESFSFQLNESSGWLTSGVSSTASVIKHVLSDVTQIRIRGEFGYGADTGRLDNVSVNVLPKVNIVPEPGALSILALGLLGLPFLSKRSRKNIRIND